MRARAALLAALLAAGGARADTLELCLDEHPHPPYVLPGAQGTVPDAVRAAARAGGYAVRFQHAPLARCWSEMEAGRVHGYPAVGASQDLLQRFVFPLRAGRPDPARATARLRIMLYRRKDGAARWDGRRLHGMDGPALVPAAGMLPAERLRALGATVDPSAKTLRQNFDKLLFRRGALVAGFENDGAQLLAEPQYGEALEALARPLMVSDFYLAVTPAYYARHGARVERLWRALGRQRG